MIYKRGKKGTYWYRFMWRGKLVRESTHQTNDKIARNMESAHRTRLAMGEVGIKEKKPVPQLGEFIKKRFEPWAKTTFEKNSPQTWRSWYRPSLRAISACSTLANRGLDEITSEHAAGFAAHLQTERPSRRPGGKPTRALAANSINARLRVLRRVFHLAVEWGVIENAPKIAIVPGARHRERVLLPDEEARYLAAAPVLLSEVATVLVDTGMRPEECFRQRWENVTWVNGRHGTLIVTHGKTAAARRLLPMTPRVRAILEDRWTADNKPEEGWIWPASTKSGHIEPSTLKKQHRKAIQDSKVRPFVLYTMRHTFLTRLAARGASLDSLSKNC